MNTKAGKLVVFLGLVLLSGSCPAGSLVGKNAPEITIREWVTENPPDVKNLADRVYVLEFWATWCPPCRETIPHLRQLNDKYKDSGLLFISISADKSAQTVQKFVHDKKINYHVAIDNGTADWFGITGYPTALVVNHKGKVTWQGYPWEVKFEQAINKAINEGPPPLLAGIGLGVFENYREALWGGKDFAGAYNQIRKFADNPSRSEDSLTAGKIIEKIDKTIAQQLDQANLLRQKDLLQAYAIYLDVATKYDGIASALPAKKACQKLQKAGLEQRQLLAKKIDQPTQ